MILYYIQGLVFPIIISIIDDWCYETSCHHFDKIMVVTMTWLAITEYLCYKWPRTCFVVAITIRSFPHSWLITGFVTIVTRRVPNVEQEMNNIQAHMSSTPDFSGVRIARPWGFYVVLCTSLFVRLSFFVFPLYYLSFFDLRLLIILLISVFPFYFSPLKID